VCPGQRSPQLGGVVPVAQARSSSQEPSFDEGLAQMKAVAETTAGKK
jgi:hypothetical protein